MLNEALLRLAPGPWPDEGPVAVDAAAFADFRTKSRLRMLEPDRRMVGDEGPVELGKLEALCAALEGPHARRPAEPGKAGRFRRTLAGAMVTLSGTKLTVERAPLPPYRRENRAIRPEKAPFTKPR